MSPGQPPAESGADKTQLPPFEVADDSEALDDDDAHGREESLPVLGVKEDRGDDGEADEDEVVQIDVVVEETEEVENGVLGNGDPQEALDDCRNNPVA